MHDFTSHQEERRQPSVTSQEKEEYEKRIHDLESRLAAVEARDPKMDQMFDVLFRRMKEAVSVILQIVTLMVDTAIKLDPPSDVPSSFCGADSCRTGM